MAARFKFGISKCWTREGSVFILGADGKRHRIQSLSDLDKIVVPAQSSKGSTGKSSRTGVNKKKK